MSTRPRILLIGTLDTKGSEIAYVRDRLIALGARPTVIDSGIMGSPLDIVPDIDRQHVAAAAGRSIDAVRRAGSRGAAVTQMSEGLRKVCSDLWESGHADGALCLGGAEGALLGAAAMQMLPVGVPKLIITPCASGRRRFAPFVGESDITLMHSVVDIIGLHSLARTIFDNAAAAVVGMARNSSTHRGAATADGFPAQVGVTMLGNTTPGVMRLRTRLDDAGYETVVFHANGVGGALMERTAVGGSFAGIIDYTLAEISNTLMDGILTAPPERLSISAESALPRIVVPGGVDFFNQPAPVPAQWQCRQTYHHNPSSTLVRLLPGEMRSVGETLAHRLNAARGPVRVVVPTRGFSLNDVPGGRLWNPDADAAFIDALTSTLQPHIAVDLVPTHVNDPAFADIVAEHFISLVRRSNSAPDSRPAASGGRHSRQPSPVGGP
ncbi:Tm-1-like ATP-binding domain-containing protein [Microlunatus ginsengisoli]|uniref:Uncharacterized protein n=1 Tax=Microlunatus ginsengisoli TaxID=363863 RepID=A0ABP7AKY6_9ACTN